MKFYRDTRTESGHEAGIEMALRSILVSPEFLFRVEQDPPGIAARSAYRVGDLELATRLSFFLWSSIPDDELLDAATRGKLHNPATLEQQVRRMLADSRSRALVTNFADQWLYLRNLDSSHPDMRAFPDFDDNLRQAFHQETELFFESVMREDRSILDLIRGQLHLPQRAPRQTLRNSQHLRQPLPPRHFRTGGRARRPPSPGQHSDGHLLPHTDLARNSRQVDPRQHPRCASASSARRRPEFERGSRRR